MKNNIKKIAKKIINPTTYSSDAFVDYLRKLGGIDTVGKHTYFFSPKNTTIDKKRIKYLKIGNQLKKCY